MSVPQSKQEWLDLMIRTSLEGGFPSMSDGGTGGACAYRGFNDRRCVVGLLIPDDEYRDAMEGPIGPALRRTFPAWVYEGPIAVDMYAVQRCHDLQTVREGWDKPWSHEKFVDDLKDTKIFSDCKFPDESKA